MITKSDVVDELSSSGVSFDDFGDIISIERKKLPDLDFHFDMDGSLLSIVSGKTTYVPEGYKFVVYSGIARLKKGREEYGFVLC